MGANSSCCTLAGKSSTAECETLLVPPSIIDKSSSSDSGKRPKDIDSWYLDVFELNDRQLVDVAAWILHQQRRGCSAIEVEKLDVFAHIVCSGYLPNPYHNRRHAVDVMHTVWRFGELMPWGQVYQDQEQFALVVAALAHDIGHFGLTNAFLVDVRDELAIYYNDISPLENMHCNKLFCILSGDKANVFAHLSPQEFRSIRKMIIDVILHTDPVHHGAMIKDLNRVYASNPQMFSGPKQGLLSDAIAELLSLSENKVVIARTLLHAADLANPGKPWEITFAWAHAVMDEFFAQGDKEKMLCLPVGMLNDREKVNLPNSQLGFIQFMVAPFVTAYTRMFRNWWDIASMLGSNVEEWSRIYFQESGIDESNRVRVVRGMLDAAKGLDINDVRWPVNVNPPADMTDADGDFDSLLLKVEDTDKDCIMVREVRRWRENKELQQQHQQQQQQQPLRELVLLYVMSDPGALANGDDIVMKFNATHTHFRQPEETAQTSDTSKGQRVVNVSVSADNMLSVVDHADFDRLLASLLEKSARESRLTVGSAP